MASNVISAAQVNSYYGSELDGDAKLGLQSGRVYQILRDPGELAKGAATFAGKPLQVEHRQQSADDHNAALVVGSVNNPRWDSPYLKAELTIWDKNAITAVQDRSQCALSCGYWFDLDMSPGSYQGQPYNGRFTNIRGNHVSLVPEGRVAGAMVGDAAIQKRKLVMADSDDARGKLLEFLASKLNGEDLLQAIKIVDGVDNDETDEAEAAVQAADRRRQAADARMRSMSADTERRAKLFPNAHRLVR